jgi:hypothetical protein
MAVSLSHWLTRIELAWRARDFPVAQVLRPGLPADEVRRRLAVIDVPAHEDLVTWFSWHDGTPTDSPFSAVPAGFLYSLDDAVRDWHDLLAGGADARLNEFLRDWFPIISAGPDMLCVHSTSGELGYHDIVELGPPPPWRRLPSLTYTVERWVHRVQDGRWYWNAESRHIVRAEGEEEDEELRRSGAF